MTTMNQMFQSGNARAFIEWHPSQREHIVWLFDKDNVITMSENGPQVNALQEGTAASEDQFFMKFAPEMEDYIIDYVKALAKAFDLYSDQPGKAYDQGFAEGENKILREWMASQKELVSDLKEGVVQWAETAEAGGKLVIT